MFNIEMIGRQRPAVMPRVVMIDLDGTVSTVRGGWHKILIGMETEILRETPKGKNLPEIELKEKIKKMIELQIGKQTIFQAYALAEAVRELDGTPRPAEEYNEQYHRLLHQTVGPRLEKLRQGGDPCEFTVPGTHELLEMLRRRGLKLYLVSGTNDPEVKYDGELLQIAEFFDGGMFGGLPEPEAFSKEIMVRRILEENSIRGEELLGIGDGITETLDVKNVGGFTIGVASDEINRSGEADHWKRAQLLHAGADWIIPDYAEIPQIEAALFG